MRNENFSAKKNYVLRILLQSAEFNRRFFCRQVQKMKKKLKTINKFNQSHKNLRKFLRLVSYGCYHRNLFERHEITPRSYDDFLRQMRFFIPQENIQVTWHDKRAYFSFVGNFRNDCENYLYKSFLLKTILPEHCLYGTAILQTLEREKKSLPLQEIIEKVSEAILNFRPQILETDADLSQLIRRRLNEMTESGILRRELKNNKFFYSKIENPLNDFSAEEIEILSAAVNFCKNFFMIETVGYFLQDSLKNFYSAPELPKMFWFKNNNFVRILDDDILLTVTNALKLKKKILVKRENKPAIIVTPLSIETDFLCSRQYLSAMNKKEFFRLRLDKIIEVSIVKENSDSVNISKEKLREIKLSVHFKNFDDRKEKEKILREEFEIKIIAEEENFFVCAIKTTDPLQFYPKLWKFQTWAEILPGDDGLRERMKKDAEEALKNYAETF